MKHWASVGVIAIVLSSPVHANGPNAAELLQACKTAPDAPTDFCKSYISNALHHFSASPISRQTFCFPDGVDADQTLTQAITSFVEFAVTMDRFRGLEKQDAGAVLVFALGKEFACSK